MKKTLKCLMAAMLAMLLTLTTVASNKLSANAADTPLTGYSANEIVSMMDKGFNIGNSLEATGGNRTDILSQEKSWGNPEVTKALLHGIKEAGFNVVRIPITWQKFLANDNTIDERWMNHVKEIVDWAIAEDLFVIINMHHEDTWLNISKLGDSYDTVSVKFAAIWTQVAEAFADYDQRLIFESMNEPRARGTSYEWTGTQKEYDVVNKLNQDFVNIVRGNGKGHNNERVLGIPGYAASSNKQVLESIVMPTWEGKTAENLAIAIHCYSPYNFCLSDAQNTFNPEDTADTADIIRLFDDINKLFTSKGIPAYIGECGATRTGDNLSEREKWFDYFGRIASKNDIPAIVWDNGVNGRSGGENHSYLKRRTGEMVNPTLIDAFINGIPEPPATDIHIDFEPVKEGGSTKIYTPQDLGFTSGKLRNQARVNHSEGATVGYSMKVDSNVEDGKAYLSLRKFGGLNVKVTAYVHATDSVVSMGISADGQEALYTSYDYNAGSGWKGLGMAVTVPEGEELYLVFAGENGKVYSVDDIDVQIVDSLEGITFEFTGETVGEEVKEPETVKEPDKTETSVSAVTESSADKADDVLPQTPDEASSNASFRIAIILSAVFAVAIVVIAITVNAAKKKKK